LASLRARPALVHAANSAAALGSRAYAGDLVRPGIFLYGGSAGGRAPLPVVRLRARVVANRTVQAGETVSYGGEWTAPRQTHVATLGIGYADGVFRSLGNRGRVELEGRSVPIIGRVTMDFVMVAVEERCEVGQIATLFGGLVSLDEQAGYAGTIAYELLTALGPRVARRYTASAT
jgi:alanine racemase